MKCGKRYTSFAGCTFITGALTCPGSITSGVGSGSTGALDLVGKTSGATSTLTVDDSNTATVVKLPNDATSGLYAVTTPSATPAAGCAQFDVVLASSGLSLCVGFWSVRH